MGVSLNLLPPERLKMQCIVTKLSVSVGLMQVLSMYPVDINVVNDKLVQWIVQRNRESMQSLTSNSASPYETDQYQHGIYARKLNKKLEESFILG